MGEPPADLLRARLFLDTSALFAGIWSDAGGARALLLLGEAGAVEVVVSPEVLAELDGAIRRKAPELLGSVTLLLARANVLVCPAAKADEVQVLLPLVPHRGDAAVVAAALAEQPDWFVSLDRRHLLGNAELAERCPFPIGTPGDALAWWRDR